MRMYISIIVQSDNWKDKRN